MVDPLRIAVLPIGELDTDIVRNELEAMVASIRMLEADVLAAEPAPDAERARQIVLELSERTPDFFLIVPLRGLSAQAIEISIRTSRAPCLIWPVQGRFALPSSALALGAVQGSGLVVELLYAPTDLPKTQNKVRQFATAAQAFSQLRKTRIGIIGGLFPNLVACRYNPEILTTRLGLTLHPISFEEIRSAIHSSSQLTDDVEASRQEITQRYKVPAAEQNALRAGIQLHQVLKRIAQEQKLSGFAAECWSAFPKELGMNPCLGFLEDAYTLACEGDALLLIALLIARYMTGKSAYAGDLFDVDMEGLVTLVHCGGPASLAPDPSQVVVAKSQLATERGFETMTCRPRLDPGPVTLFRLFGGNCDRIHMAAGELKACELSENLTVIVRLAGDRWDFLAQCFGNHYVMVAGDIRGELKLLSKWLGINTIET